MRSTVRPRDPRPLPGTLAPALLEWFAAHRRPLPWRRDRDPYHVWVAEVLLQQTRVVQALPYYEGFLRAFPDLPTLARSPLGRVLRAWQGAGYYARARHLHAAARTILREHGGRFPTTVAELEALPGVGPYIARAVAALAFDAPVVALEANGLRVAARWTGERGDVRTHAVRQRLETALNDVRGAAPGGSFNEAVMELGETVCAPQHPRCERCPVAFGCRAHRELDDPSILPRRAPRRRRPRIRGVVVILTDPDGRWLVQRRPPRGLLGGLWEFPGGKIEPGERREEAARRELREETGVSVGRLEPLGVVRHAYSHFSVELHAFRAEVAASTVVVRASDRRWVRPAGLTRLPVPKATEKIARLARTRKDRASPGSRFRPGRTAASRSRGDRSVPGRAHGPGSRP